MQDTSTGYFTVHEILYVTAMFPLQKKEAVVAVG